MNERSTSGDSASRRVNLHAIDATLDVHPAPTQDVPKRCHACSKGVGIALGLEPKTILDKSFGLTMDSVRAVAAGARLARDVRGQNRRDRAATCRACVLLYLPS